MSVVPPRFPRDKRCSVCEGRTQGFCGALDAHDFAELERIKGEIRVLQQGAVLYAQNDPATDYFVVLDGWIERSILLETGERQILDFALRGALLGFLADPAALFDHTAKCITTVRICTLPRPQMNALLAKDGRLAVCLARLLAHDVSTGASHLTNVGLRAARERIAHLLLELFFRVRHRLPTEAGDWASIPLSQGHIGEALALTSVHVSRTLRVLREQQILSFSDGRLTVLDPTALIRAAGLEVTGDGTGQIAGSYTAFCRALSLPDGWRDMISENTTA